MSRTLDPIPDGPIQEASTTIPRKPPTPIPPEVQETFEMIAVECHKAMVIKKFNAAHDDGHSDKSLAVTAAFLLQDYYEPGNQEERSVTRHVTMKMRLGRDPWPAAYAHRKFNDSLELQRLVIAAQFTVSEIARVLRAQRVVAQNATGEKKGQAGTDWREAAYERDCP